MLRNNGVLGNFNFNSDSGWVIGRKGNALHFDGINDQVNVIDSSSLDITKNLTISAWIKSDVINDTNSGKRIVIKGNDTNPNYALRTGWGQSYHFDSSIA